MPASLERVVHLVENDEHYIFFVEHRDGVPFWTMEHRGRFYPIAMIVDGNEQPGFFRAVVRSVTEMIR